MEIRATVLGRRRRESPLAIAVGRLLGAYRRRRATRRMITLLSGLEDRTLADIGVARDQIPAIARRLARRYG